MKKQVSSVGCCCCRACISPGRSDRRPAAFPEPSQIKGGALLRSAGQCDVDATAAVREPPRTTPAITPFPLLPVSVYTLRVELTGFQTTETKDLKLQSMRRASQLLVGAATVSTVSRSILVGSDHRDRQPRARPGHHLPASRPKLPLMVATSCSGDLDARHDARDQHRQLLQRRPQLRSLRAWFLFPLGWRLARQQHRLVAGRHR